MKTKHHTMSAAVAKGGNHVRNNPICPRWFALALGGFLFTSIFALSAPPVEAQCQQYDVSGGYNISEGNIAVVVALSQNGTTVSGTAYHRAYYGDGNYKHVHGRVTGTVEGNKFGVEINWAGGMVGIYRGKINQAGTLKGKVYEKSKPSSTTTWEVIGHPFQCAPESAVQPTPKVIKSTGHMPKPETKSASAAADEWLEQERLKRKTATQTTPSTSNKPRGFINGLQLGTPTPTPNAEAEESSSSDTEDQHRKHKKNKKKKHHHHDDDQNQGND